MTAVADDSDTLLEGKDVKKPNRLIFSRVFLTSYGLKNCGRAFAAPRFGATVCGASTATADAPLSARQMRTAENDFLNVMLLFVGVIANVAMTIWRN